MSGSGPGSWHSFGELVRRRRRALELTQQQLAQRVSCSEDMVRKIEADLRRPSRWLAGRLMAHLRIGSADQAGFLNAARLGRATPARDARPEAEHRSVPLVGRDAQRERFAEALDAALAGSGSLVLIEGEAGIGKTTLVQAAMADAAARGFAGCATTCYEIARAIPLQPWIDWVDRLVDIVGVSLIDTLPPAIQAELADLSPHLRELRPSLPEPSGEPELRRTRIFSAYAQLAAAAARDQPLLVVVDDLHWADDMTLALLHHLVRHTRRLPVVIVGALRSEELAAGQALPAFVEGAVAELGAMRLALGRWSVDDVQRLVSALERTVPEGLAERLYAVSEGHPLYVGSMLQQWRELGGGSDLAFPMPPALRDSIRERLRRLPPPARALLDMAAVLGRHFDFLTLERGAGMAGVALAEGVELLVQRRLLREVDGAAGFDFSHDRIREVVYADLGTARRIVLHRHAAEALQAAGAQDDALMAGHYELARQWDAAIRHWERAAERSLRLYALRESVGAAERALALAEAHPSACDAAMRVRLHEHLGDAHAQDGRCAEAVAVFEAALAGAQALGDAGWARDLLTKLGMAHRRADDYGRAVDRLGQALAVSRSLDDASHVADTLYHLGTVAWSDGDNTLALRCHTEAVQLCETHGLGGWVAMQAWHGMGEALFAAARPREAMTRFERSLSLARELGDRGYEAENVMMLGWCCTGAMGVADYAFATDQADLGLAVAQAAQQEWHLTPLRILQADAWRCAGEVPSALELLNSELARIEQLGQVRFCIMALDVLGRLWLEQGRPGDARDCFLRALQMGVDRRVHFWRAQVEAGLALARLEEGEPLDREGLSRTSEAALAHSERCAHARCLQVLSEGALRAGQFSLARDEAGRLLALSGQAGLRELSAHACWLLGRSWIDEAPQRARVHLVQAREEAEAIHRPWLARQVCESLALVG